MNSVINQVDTIFIALNGYQEAPDYVLNNPKIHYDILDNSLSDSAKFYHVAEVDGYYFGCDDDLVYPSNYVSYMIGGIERYKGLVSLHGRKYPPNPEFRRWIGNYRCLNTVPNDTSVNLIGSGCCAFDTNTLRLSIDDFKTPHKADCYLSMQAGLQGVPMVVLAHKIGYLTYLYPEKTIWGMTKNYSEHTQILRSYIK